MRRLFIEALEPKNPLAASIPEIVADLDAHPLYYWGDGGWDAPVRRGDEVLFFVRGRESHVSVVQSDGTSEGSGIVTRIGPGVGSVGHSATIADRTVFLLFSESRKGELWVTDGTEEGTTWLLQTTGRISEFVELGSFLYFGQGHELWRTDGTSQGTMAVPGAPPIKDLRSGHMTTLDNDLVFLADDEQAGTNLWTTDGFVTETAPFSSFPDGVTPESLMGNGQSLYVVTSVAGSSSVGLWYANDSSDGVSLVAEIPDIGAWAIADKDLFFAADSSDRTQHALYRADGDELTLSVVREFETTGWSSAEFMVPFGKGVLFGSRVLAGAWISDGTANGTKSIYDGQVWGPFHAGEKGAYFRSDDGVRWTDGTREGTRLLIDQQVYYTILLDDDLFFNVDDVLWHTDGTVENTRDVYQFPKHTRSSSPVHLGQAGERQIYRTRADRLYSTDGQDVVEVLDVSERFVRARVEPVRQQVEGLFFFRIRDRGVPPVVWVTDGTKNGTQPLGEIRSGQKNSLANDFVQVGESVYFHANDYELWATTGTAESTRQIHSFQGEITRIVSVGNRLVVATRHGTRLDLWSWDVTHSNEPQQLHGISYPLVIMGGLQYPTVVGQELFFVVYNGLGQHEIWRTRGTAESTKHLGTLHDRWVHFAADLDGKWVAVVKTLSGTEVWMSDGSIESTRATVMGLPTINRGQPFAATQSHVVSISCEDSECTVWSSDGTPTGTRSLPQLAVDSNPRLATATVSRLHGAEDAVFVGTSRFVHRGGSTFWEHTIWRTDGTPEGTYLVRDPTVDGLLSTAELHLVPLKNDQLLFTLHSELGEELWRLDAPAPVIGDLNGDSLVDLMDFSSLAGNFGKTTDAVLAEGDIDGDGDVDFADFVLLAKNFQTDK